MISGWVRSKSGSSITDSHARASYRLVTNAICGDRTPGSGLAQYVLTLGSRTTATRPKSAEDNPSFIRSPYKLCTGKVTHRDAASSRFGVPNEPSASGRQRLSGSLLILAKSPVETVHHETRFLEIPMQPCVILALHEGRRLPPY